jgi:hypothetical protein
VILWTASARGSDNAIGDLPFIAPMKIELLKSVKLEKKRRHSVALLFCVCLTLVVFMVAAGQVKNSKHITAIQLGGAAEGSRVTVVSDSPLIDYEAFRRGDRFYVKIPLADLSGAAPHFRADGFEDVQVQKVGDSLIVSFKLQPGASARVDQRGNRLDVIFSAANKIPLLNTGNQQPSGDRGADAAGPMPLDSATSRVRTITGRDGSINETRGTGEPRWQSFPKTNSNKTGDNRSTTTNLATASASPSSSPSSILSPGTSTSYQPLSATTPRAESTSSPANSGSTGFLNWRNRLTAARQWMSANRLATLLGALILLSLIVYLVFVMRRRQETVVKTRQAKTPKVQPRYSPSDELNEISEAGTDAQMPRQDSGAAKPFNRPSSSGGALTRPTIVSPSAGHDEQIREEEEREVFEL